MANNDPKRPLQDLSKRSDLTPGDKTDLSRGVADVLADTYVLLVKTHVYHWNVTGVHFVPMHQLLEVHYKDLFAAADELAERIRSLGRLAPLNFGKDLLPRSDVEEERSDRSATGMIRQLVADHEEIARRIREVSSEAADRKDYVTHDLLNQRLAFHEKAIWMLQAIVADEVEPPRSIDSAAKLKSRNEASRAAVTT